METERDSDGNTVAVEIPRVEENRNNKLLTFEEFLSIVEGFLHRPATLMDSSYECVGVLSEVQSKNGYFLLTFSHLKRRKRFSGAAFESFHEQERKVKINSTMCFERIENGRMLYIALRPGVHYVYLGKEYKKQ